MSYPAGDFSYTKFTYMIGFTQKKKIQIECNIISIYLGVVMSFKTNSHAVSILKLAWLIRLKYQAKKIFRKKTDFI